jgi:hypothetical protein
VAELVVLPELKEYACESLLLDLLLHFILVDDLLEIPQPFGSVVEDVLLADALPHDLVEDDLETHRDAAPLQVVVVVLPDLLDARVLLPTVAALLLH